MHGPGDSERVDGRVNRQRQTIQGGMQSISEAGRTPFDHVAEADDDAHDPANAIRREEMQIRQETMQYLLAWIFFDGKRPDPTTVAQRACMLAQQFAPHLLGGADDFAKLAAIFGDTRAAWSHRAKSWMKDAAGKPIRGANQRNEENKARCRKAQKGNSNRKKK